MYSPEWKRQKPGSRNTTQTLPPGQPGGLFFRDYPQPVASTTEVDRDFEGASVPWETGREQWGFFHYGPGDNHPPAPRDLGFGLSPSRQTSYFLLWRHKCLLFCWAGRLLQVMEQLTPASAGYLFTFCISLIFFLPFRFMFMLWVF